MRSLCYCSVLYALGFWQASAHRNADRSHSRTLVLQTLESDYDTFQQSKKSAEEDVHHLSPQPLTSNIGKSKQQSRNSSIHSSFSHTNIELTMDISMKTWTIMLITIAVVLTIILCWILCVPRHADFLMSMEFVVDVPADKLVEFITPPETFVPIIIDLEGISPATNNQPKVEDKGDGHLVLIDVVPFPIHVMDRAVIQRKGDDPAKLVYNIRTGEDPDKPIISNDQVWEFFTEDHEKCRVKRTVTNFRQERKLFIPGQTLLKQAIEEEVARFREFFAKPANRMQFREYDAEDMVDDSDLETKEDK